MELCITRRDDKGRVNVMFYYYNPRSTRSQFFNIIISFVRWTRREEADFYRVVSTFGVVYDTQRQKFDWAQFRAFARLDKKTDESLEKYYYSFIAMCKRVCRMQIKTETGKGQFVWHCYSTFLEMLGHAVTSSFISSELPDPTLIIDPITEERASRTLYRIELLRRIREQVLPHPMLAERLKLCQPSPDLPEWWESGRHDHDLLLGASKHGVSRTDYHILNDPALAFLEAHQRFTSHRGTGSSIGAQGEMAKGGMGAAESTSVPLLTPAELASVAAATKVVIPTVKVEEEEEGKNMKTEEGTTEMDMKMEIDGDDILCTKTEVPDEQKENKGEIGEGKDETTSSPREAEEVVKEEELQVEQSGEVEKTPKRTHDKELREDENSLSLVEHKHTATELSGLSKSPPKVQPGQKTVEEVEGEERENPESPKSPKSADTEKSPEEEEEERMDEDDKSEKSSQAEGL